MLLGYVFFSLLPLQGTLVFSLVLLSSCLLGDHVADSYPFTF